MYKSWELVMFDSIKYRRFNFYPLLPPVFDISVLQCAGGGKCPET